MEWHNSRLRFRLLMSAFLLCAAGPALAIAEGYGDGSRTFTAPEDMTEAVWSRASDEVVSQRICKQFEATSKNEIDRNRSSQSLSGWLFLPAEIH